MYVPLHILKPGTEREGTKVTRLLLDSSDIDDAYQTLRTSVMACSLPVPRELCYVLGTKQEQEILTRRQKDIFMHEGPCYVVGWW